ncbi:MAG TPA: beta-ketoacyl-ACP synthase III [Actinocrinis sp.]|uniref:beta-ketoacyl-ACP synthase III n=2 Tax=Actinocrinis sp. TaxID=1920516 RepID=UPI002D60A788|nr:beta-ketoacyl-ACP synthase III [Actinocrinis sp.]HZU55007.1 beta-ketoacyl-ACP synthase III [Actinocrinis sp.]
MTQIQSPAGAPHARILGVGGYRPSRVITNEQICQLIDSSDEWIRTRTGIQERRWATAEETVGVMSLAAAGKALASAGIEPERIGCVVISTVTHLSQTPSLAADVANQLGAINAAAFDISAACAGFCHGLALAQDMIRGGSAEYVLVIGVERLSDLTDMNDRSTAFIFGDGAGAAVVGPSQTPGIGPVVWGADGGQLDAIGQTFSWDALRHQPDLGFPALRMSGQQVFRWASYQMVPVAKKALERAGITADQLDAFIPHQANMRITDAMIKALKLPEHVPVARDIATQGNTSAASIPLAMERMLEEGEAPHGGAALLIGFGAGLVYAAQVVVLP